jgi:catechol 2,3-dioxygenase-like lactoylglutathione lyase family enzyme
MHRLIGKAAIFAAGVAAGIVLMQPGSAQQGPAQQKSAGLRLNHVGVYAKDYEESLRFYTNVMGFKEAFTIRDASGKPTLTYLHITRDTFLELAPATGDRVPGLSHIGIWPEDQRAAVEILRQRGAKINDPRTGSTGSSITNVVDPNGVRLEVIDFLAGSVTRKAIDNYQP